MSAIVTGALFDFYQQKIQELKGKEAAGTLTEREAQILAQHRAKWKTQNYNSYDIKDILLFVMLLKLSKTPQGVETLKSFFKIIGDALDSLGKASAANPITAWANPYLISCVLERFGFVSSGRMVEFRIGLSLISGASIAEGFLDTIQGIMPFSKGEPSEFPSQIDLGDKTYVLETPEQFKFKAKEKKEKG